MGARPFIPELADSSSAAEDMMKTNRGLSGMMKRLTDIVLSFSALVFLLPVLLPIALFIRLSDGGPAVFKQRRIGRFGEEFWCYKFRSMVTDANERLEELLANDPKARREWEMTQKLENDPRITRFGHFLRKSSLDELPQLINILLGEMSIVGPRPIVRNEAEKYGKFFVHYCHMRPGLTGLWQVSGRSDTTYDERVAMDVRYVSEWSYSNDLLIMAKTVPAVLMSDGAR